MKRICYTEICQLSNKNLLDKKLPTAILKNHNFKNKGKKNICTKCGVILSCPKEK